MSGDSIAEDGGADLGLLQESLSKSSIEEWKETAAECVRNDLFNKKQFLVNDKEPDMGGTMQKLIAVFDVLEITNECQNNRNPECS